MLGDLRYALRLFVRSPLFTVTSVLSLAIGMGAAATIFGLVDALLLQPTPGVREAARIVDIERTTDGRGHGPLSSPVFRHLQDHAQTLESMAAVASEPTALAMTDDSLTERVYGTPVTARYFDVLKVRPAIGRFFTAEEDAVAGAHSVAVLSHRLWRDRFRSDPGAFDRPVLLNNREFVVIGVAEAGFGRATIVGTDLWLPAHALVLQGPGTERLADPAAS